MRNRFYTLYSFLATAKEGITIWIAWRLPRYLVMWCFYRVFAHATSGQYCNTGVPGLSMMDAIERWGTSLKPELESGIAQVKERAAEAEE